MVPDGLDAQVQLLGDLLRRSASLEQDEHLRLPGRELELRVRMGLLDEVGDLAEDAEEVVSVVDRDRADLDRDALAVRADDLDDRVSDPRGADHFSREELPRPPSVLGRDDRRELGPAHVADDAARRSVQPTNDPGRVDVVARDVDVLEYLLEVDDVESRRNPRVQFESPISAGSRSPTSSGRSSSRTRQSKYTYAVVRATNGIATA